MDLNVGAVRKFSRARIIIVSLPHNVFYVVHPREARVVKLVDAGDSKSPAARRAGSIPAPGTTLKSLVFTRT